MDGAHGIRNFQCRIYLDINLNQELWEDDLLESLWLRRNALPTMYVHNSHLMQAPQPTWAGDGVLEVKDPCVEHLPDIDFGVFSFDDLGGRVECLHIRLDASQRFGIDTIDF